MPQLTVTGPGVLGTQRNVCFIFARNLYGYRHIRPVLDRGYNGWCCFGRGFKTQPPNGMFAAGSKGHVGNRDAFNARIATC